MRLYGVAFLLICLSMGSCRLFRLQFKEEIPVTPDNLFPNQPVPGLHNAMRMHFGTNAETYSDVFIYPKGGGHTFFDFEGGETKGTLIFADTAWKAAAWVYPVLPVEDTRSVQHMNTQSAHWLPLKNYLELQNSGRSVINFVEQGDEGPDSWFFAGMDTFHVTRNLEIQTWPCVKLQSRYNGKTLKLLNDASYPLILSYNGVEKTRLAEVLDSIAHPAFDFKPGAELEYMITEGGVTHTQVTLKTLLVTDTAIRFDLSGNYAGSYTYSFHYQYTVALNALQRPVYQDPVFFASAGDQRTVRNNWFLLGPEDLNAIATADTVDLRIPHFALDPAEADTSGMGISEAEYLNWKKEYNESHHTVFQCRKGGRMWEFPWLVDGEVAPDYQVLPATELSGEDVTMKVWKAGRYPILLEYDDNRMMRIQLKAVRRAP
ncbi:MAG: hypothetical protein JNL57_05355 [Bacteroidetes bacterium]|nr:hypothetical protein [Bacteroidota bacterium]